MGIAMWSTLSAMFITAFGALSLSTNPDVVRTSYWALLEARNSTDGARTRYYVGLRSIVTIYDEGDVANDRLEIDYYVGRIPGSRSGDEMREKILRSCANSAAGNQIGARAASARSAFYRVAPSVRTRRRAPLVRDARLCAHRDD